MKSWIWKTWPSLFPWKNLRSIFLTHPRAGHCVLYSRWPRQALVWNVQFPVFQRISKKKHFLSIFLSWGTLSPTFLILLCPGKPNTSAGRGVPPPYWSFPLEGSAVEISLCIVFFFKNLLFKKFMQWEEICIIYIYNFKRTVILLPAPFLSHSLSLSFFQV